MDGMVRCHDCGKDFSWIALLSHHQQIEAQSRELIKNEEHFRQALDTTSVDVDPLLSQIAEWKKQSIQRIKQIAKEVKEDLQRRREQSKEQMKTSFEDFHRRLEEFQRKEFHSEKELQRLNEQFNNLQKQNDSLQLTQSWPSNSLLRLEQTPKMELEIERPKTKIEGPTTRIVEVDRLGHYLLLENVGLKDVDLVGWSLQGLKEDSEESLLYRLTSECRLAPNQSIRILSQRASQTLYSFDRANCWIASSVSNWIFHSPRSRKSYRLIDPQGQEQHLFILQ